MRPATLVLLASLGLCAYAQEEGALVRPKLRLPGERSYADFAIPEADFQGINPEDEEAIKDKLKALNDERAQLKEKLQAALEKMLAARRELNQILAQLDQQEAALVEYLAQKLQADKGKLAVRVRLRPIIEWLELDDAQVNQLITKQMELLDLVDIRRRIAQAARAAAAGAAPKTKKERAEKIALLKEYDQKNRRWIANIRDVIKDDQEKLDKFNLRYRRTRYSLEGGL